jgi:GNAT superfamily N-acetyltransferase
MPTAVVPTNKSVRLIEANDLERVIEIDRAYTGRSRRRFFEKRFACAAANPDDFVQLGLTRGGSLRGYAIARLLHGEFGRRDAVAVLDVLGVAPESREQGVGQALIERLVEVLRRKGVRSLHSQAAWTNVELLHFFDAAGFRLSPRTVLDRLAAEPVIEPLEEPL